MGLIARLGLLALAVTALAAGIAGGLVRLGVELQAPLSAAAFHGALMIAGFLGTVISIERAIALGSPWAFAAPLAAGLGTLAILFGATLLAHAAWLLAPLLLAAVSAAIVRRQRALHTVLLLVASIAWGCGNALQAFGGNPAATHAWWFAFLVLTIAAERLEMTRLMKRRAAATPLFVACVALLLAAASAMTASAALGSTLYGAALVALASWLAVFDIARRTVRMEGFARYAAVGLLGGYAWLAVAGLAWIAMPFSTLPLRDAALHALGLGFVVSMIFAHAPLVVPVIARAPMRFTPFFYAPLALLHLSLALRLGPGMDDLGSRAAGGVLNAVAFALFVATLLVSLLRGQRDRKRRHEARGQQPQVGDDAELQRGDRPERRP